MTNQSDDLDTSSLDLDDADDDAALDTEMALLAMTASGDIGGPLQDLDLDSLSSEEKRALLAYLRHRLNLAPDLIDLSDDKSENGRDVSAGRAAALPKRTNRV